MGIRWYGWEITAEESQRAATDPWGVIHEADARYDDPSWAVTDFDKAWTGLQRLFSDPARTGRFASRPAFELVAGNVTDLVGDEYGYEPYIGLISAHRVHAIASDLRMVTEVDIRTYCEAWGPYGYPDEVAHFLGLAREFTEAVSSRGHDIIYVIK